MIFRKKKNKKEDSAWTKFWKNKRHNYIYYFSSAVLALLIVFAINVVSISVLYNQRVAAMYANTLVFNSSTKTTLTGVPVSVMTARVSEDRSQMFILLQISDLTNIPSNINSYEIYVTDVDKHLDKIKRPPKEDIRGQYYMFGMTGYVGIYLWVEDGRFSDSYKWITIRSHDVITNNRRPHVHLMVEDVMYDQYHIFVNPMSLSARTIDFLETNERGRQINPVDVYKQAISESLESQIKDEILSSLVELEDVMLSIIEYRRRLSNDYNLVVPEMSTVIAGDHIEEIDMFDDDGNYIRTRRQFNFAGVVRGGIDLDWRNLSLRTGYYQAFYESGVFALNEFLSDLKAQPRQSRTDGVTVAATEWTFQDGTSIDTSLAGNATVVSEIAVYNGHVQKYVDIKTKIQADLFVQLLELEYATQTHMGTARVLSDSEDSEGNIRRVLFTW